MANEIKVGAATIKLTDPRFRRSRRGIVLALGRCRTGAFVARNGETITFFPRVGPQKPRRLRRVLDAINGPPAFKIENLELHLATLLGSFEYTIDASIFDKYRECYDFRAELFVTYVRCDATIGDGKGRLVFTIDFPVGARVHVTGKPVCCEDKPEVRDRIGDEHAPPEDTLGEAANDLYEKAKKREEERRKRLEKLLEDGLEWKLKLPLKYRLDPDWGFEFDYDEEEKEGKDKPVIRIKPKWGF